MGACFVFYVLRNRRVPRLRSLFMVCKVLSFVLLIGANFLHSPQL